MLVSFRMLLSYFYIFFVLIRNLQKMVKAPVLNFRRCTRARRVTFLSVLDAKWILGMGLFAIWQNWNTLVEILRNGNGYEESFIVDVVFIQH